MNEEQEEAPLEDLCVHRNHLVREKHVLRSKEQCATDADRHVTQRVVHSDVQIAVDTNPRLAHRAMRNDAQIVADANQQGTKRATCSHA
jgi:hypothetical protein